MLKLWLFADTHLYHRETPEELKEDEKPRLESGPMLDAALADFLAQPGCDILLIAGDLTHDGHAEEHRALLEKLHRVKSAGKRVVLITATHDFGGHEHIHAVKEPGVPHPKGKAYREELRGLYEELGFSDAIARCEYDGGMSYVAQLAPGYRLLCLNDDGDGRAFCGFYEPHMRWILEQIEQAKAAGEVIFAMTHHPSLPPSPIYPLISKRDMLGSWENCTRRLADAGLRVMFTGHSHMLNINTVTTPEGNPYWDVNTSSLTGWPGVFRVIELEGRRMKVTTRAITDYAWDRGGLPVREHLQRHFDYNLRSAIENAAAGNIEKVAEQAGGFSIEKEFVYKLRLPITAAGKVLNRLTLGGAGALLLCHRKIPKSVRQTQVKELILEIMRNVYAGEEHYAPDTPTGQALLAMAGRVNSLLKKKLASSPIGSLQDFLQSLIYDPTPDDYLEIVL